MSSVSTARPRWVRESGHHAAPSGTPTHAARQQADGTWLSKLGNGVDIIHDSMTVSVAITLRMASRTFLAPGLFCLVGALVAVRRYTRASPSIDDGRGVAPTKRTATPCEALSTPAGFWDRKAGRRLLKRYERLRHGPTCEDRIGLHLHSSVGPNSLGVKTLVLMFPRHERSTVGVRWVGPTWSTCSRPLAW